MTATPRYRRVQSRALPPGALRADRRILCCSDLHLRPDDGWLADDAPETVCEILDAHPEFPSVYLLGDITESLVLLPHELPQMITSPRLRAIWERLRKRPDLRIVLGNHDAFAHEVFFALAGYDRVFTSGFELDRTRFLHGHEPGGALLSTGENVGRFAVPALVTLSRFGMEGVARLAGEDNEVIAHSQRGPSHYVVFGHTHVPAVTDTYANTGCILRRPGQQTFLTIEDSIVSLWATTEPETPTA